MVDLALWLARAGYPEFWDHVERYVRNYVNQAQFFLTPVFRQIYRSANKGKPAAEVDAGLALLGRYEGGFVARVYPNDLARSRASDGMNMMGCCPPEAMRALHIAWSHIVTETGRGIEVNLAMNRDHPAARVVSFLPHEGKVTVQARRNADFYLRPPSWTLRKAVQAYVDGKASTPDWEGAYVRFAGVKSGQRLTITYPLVDFSQRVRSPEKRTPTAGSAIPCWEWSRPEPSCPCSPRFPGRCPRSASKEISPITRCFSSAPFLSGPGVCDLQSDGPSGPS